MKLGVRYIVLDTSLRPGSHEDECSVYTNLSAANHKLNWINRHGQSPERGLSLAVDLDSLPPADATEAEQHESQFVYHWAALQALRPDANPEDAVARELVRLKGECERMRAVVEAAVNICVGRWDCTECLVSPPCGKCDPCVFRNAVAAYRAAQPAEAMRDEDNYIDERAAIDTLAKAMMDEWHRVEGERVNVSRVATFADMARRIVRDHRSVLRRWSTSQPAPLTAAENEAITFVVASARANGNRMTPHQQALVSAIDKLRRGVR